MNGGVNDRSFQEYPATAKMGESRLTASDQRMDDIRHSPGL